MAELVSALHDRHLALHAKMAPFAGWSMPLEYSGIVAEHQAVRTAAGLFDVSHLGKLVVSGPGAVAYLNTRLTNNLDAIGAGQAQYTLLCFADGGVVDDIIVYRISDDLALLVPNAANCATVAERLAQGLPDGISITDRHRLDAVLAVQGPRSDAVLDAAGFGVDLEYMHHVPLTVEVGQATVTGTVCRTGYTGERGYELIVPVEAAAVVWDAIMRAGSGLGLLPCGLGARDTLRTEMGYPLHGQDLGPDITPVMARLTWAVGWKKPSFDGAEALRAQRAAGPDRLLWGIRALGRGIPRHGMDVVDGGRPVGLVTSGTFSPTLKTGIGLALLPPSVRPGDTVDVAVRQRTEAFEVVKPPFVTGSVRQG